MLFLDHPTTNSAVDPIGIDDVAPGFSWMLKSDLRNVYQTAWHIRVASSPERLISGTPDLWDSGRVESTKHIEVEYAGVALTSRQGCWWTVTVWDNHGRTASLPEPAMFEMGLLTSADWSAQWVGYNAGWTGRSLQFRRPFNLRTDQPIRRARAYFAGLGYGELYLNGRKVGDRVLDPPWTAYQRRVLYSTDDVLAMLRPGENRVGVVLGHGWFGDRKFILQIEIEYADGTREQVVSNWGWRVTPSPIVGDSVYDGEIYDARLELPGWCDPVAAEPPARPRTMGWQQAMIVEGPSGRLVSAALDPIRVVETIRPKSMERVAPGIWVFDVGRNIAGWARIRVRGEAGRRVHLRFAETVNADGTVNQENLRDARAEDVYILSGSGVEEWEPRFTYHGFRYVQVEGWPGEPRVDDLDARVVRSSAPTRSRFQCDHALINAIQRAVVHTEASNLHGVPTDCPQRDERLGWLNDITARAEESIYNFDLVRFYRKWLNDIADAQDVSGAIPDTVPHRYCFQPADPVCVGYLLLPWLMYQHCGDVKTLREHRVGMRRWVDCLDRESVGNVLSRSYYGDWAPPIYRKGLSTPPEDTAHNRDTPADLTSTAFLAYSLRLYSQIANVLGDAAEASRYQSRADEVAATFHARFWNEAKGGYGTSNQSCNALALYMNLVPDALRRRVVDSLVRDVVVVQGGRLATGNICSKYLLEVLTDASEHDVAFGIATEQAYPSWGHMIANGATTLWERWEHATGGGMNSHNHAMLGSISAWFYRSVAGLRVELPDERGLRFSIRPNVAAGMSTASADIQTVAGPVRCAWRRVGPDLQVDVELPSCTSADLHIPLTSGRPPASVWLDGHVLEPAGAEARMRDVPTLSADGSCISMCSGKHHFRIEHAFIEPTRRGVGPRKAGERE